MSIISESQELIPSVVVSVASLRPEGANTLEDLNWDLGRLSKKQLEDHYKTHATDKILQKEDRFFDETFFLARNNIKKTEFSYKQYLNDIRLFKSKYVEDLISNIPHSKKDFVLVSHLSSINGATHSLYVLANFLKTNNYSILILDINKNSEELYKKYGLDSTDFVYYYNDPTILYWACAKTKSSKIIINSINASITETVKWLDRSKVILFSRETKDNYMRQSCYEPDVVIAPFISNSYKNFPIVQTPICPLFLQNTIYEYFKEPAHIENLNSNKITVGMCGSLTKAKNVQLFLEVARRLPEYNFVWIGGELLDTSLTNVFHVKNTTNPFKYYKLLDYFVLFSEKEPFGNVIIENLLLNKKVLTFKDNVCYDFKHKLTENNYFEYDGKLNIKTAVQHITKVATDKQPNVGYLNSTSNLYVKRYFSEYKSDFLRSLQTRSIHLNQIKNITDTRVINVKCPMGFCNQLRLMLAGSYLVTNGFIESFNQEWVLNEHNNVDFLTYFELLPGVTLNTIQTNCNIKANNVINTSCFEKMITFFTNNQINPIKAFQCVASFLKPKEEFKTKIHMFGIRSDVKNALGLHLRETDKVELYPEKNISRSVEEIMSLCTEYDKVFLATDNPGTQNLFKTHLGEKLIVYSDIAVERLSRSLRYTSSDHTVADFMLLQKCKKFVGTDMSSFSTLVKYIRNIPNDGEFTLNF